MKWTRSHLTFANVISMLALFVALGGTGYAATKLAKNSVGAKQIKKNGVGASEIKKNAVGASETKTNAVGGAEIADGAVGSADVGDNAIGGSEIADNAVSGSEIGDGSVGTGEVANGSLLAADFGPDQLGPTAYARVGATGLLEASTNPASQNKGVVQENIQHDAGAPTADLTGAGVYCFGGLPFAVKSVVVTTDGADTLPAVPALTPSAGNKIANATVFRGEDLGRCDAAHGQVRVSMVQVNEATAPTLVNHGFYIQFQG